MVTVPVFDSTTPPRYQREFVDQPVHGLAALEADLLVCLAAALDAVLANADDDRRRVQAAGEMP